MIAAKFVSLSFIRGAEWKALKFRALPPRLLAMEGCERASDLFENGRDRSEGGGGGSCCFNGRLENIIGIPRSATTKTVEENGGMGSDMCGGRRGRANLKKVS